MILPSETFHDVIVVGAGHAGCEAALACARMGARTLMLTMNLDSVAQMSCNPAIGGVAKGHIVREIDALGGEMAKITDIAGIQFRMLNTSKGPAVWAPRAQCDKRQYQLTMKFVIESQPNLDLLQAEVKDILVDHDTVTGVQTHSGAVHRARAVIITTGTFLNGRIHIGEVTFGGGRAGDKPSTGLSGCLARLGLDVQRLKTGTPPRLNARTIDFAALEEQPGDAVPSPFSFQTEKITQTQLPCYLTFTNARTHELIRENINRSPLYSGKIQSKGPRYCPSIEDKVMRFADKERHQIFLEPEGRMTQEVYVNGISTSFPQDVQINLVKSIKGLENAEVMRFGYAVEYDYCQPTQVRHTLETKKIKGLYLAGQINGTSGYEEAACQGLMAGINAVLKIRGEEPFVLQRSEAYIGVLIDDLVTNGTEEPYRMFTSRAEHRLILRQDNADKRLMHYGKQYGLISEAQYAKHRSKEANIDVLMKKLKTLRHCGITVDQYLSRPEASFSEIEHLLGNDVPDKISAKKIEIELKYSGYINREVSIINRLKSYEQKRIPERFSFLSVKGMSREAQEKLERIKPTSIGQASRISGITPCDISVLAIHIEKASRA